MKYGGTLIAVSDMAKARDFYERVMEQKVLMDLGDHVSLENGLSLQANYVAIVGEKLAPKSRPDNFQLYFEVEHIEDWEKKLEKIDGLEFLHHLKEYPWGQRNIRFYDFDNYIIEVAESMDSVIRRYLSQGLSAEETSKRTMFPVEYIKSLDSH